MSESRGLSPLYCNLVELINIRLEVLMVVSTGDGAALAEPHKQALVITRPDGPSGPGRRHRHDGR